MSAISYGILLFVVFFLSFLGAFVLIFNSFHRKVNLRLSRVGVANQNLKFAKLRKYFEIFDSGILNRLMHYSMPKKDEEEAALRKKFVTAGVRGHATSAWLSRFFGFKTFFAIFAPFIYLSYFIVAVKDYSIFGLLFGVLFFTALGYYIPDFVLNYRVRARQREIFDIFPDALDLIRVCIASGMGLDAAISRVGKEIVVSSKAMSEEFGLLNLELRAGIARQVALENFALRTDLDEIKALVTMLVQSEKFGTSVSESLVIFSEDLRSKRRLLAEELAAKIPVKLMLPIILCIFPAVFIVLFSAPAMSVMPLFNGRGL